MDCKQLLEAEAVEAVDEDAKINCILTEEIIPKWLTKLQSCKEDFPPYGRLVYSSITMFIQYLLPTITIAIAYYQIYGQLKVGYKWKTVLCFPYQFD